MTTPIEDRVAALETWRTGTVDPALIQARQKITEHEQRIVTLETQYADAVVRFQKADDLAHRLVRLLRLIRSTDTSQTDNEIAKLPESVRQQIAQQREVDDGADEWKSAVFR